MHDFEALLQSGQFDDITNLGTLDDEEALVQQQLQLAQALRQRGPQRSTPLGALFGGLSDAVGNTVGTLKQDELTAQLSDILRRRKEGRGDFAKSYNQGQLGELRQGRADTMADLLRTQPFVPRLGGG